MYPRFPHRWPYPRRYRYHPAPEDPRQRLGPLARIRLDQRYARVTGLPFPPALNLFLARLRDFPAGRALLDAFQTAGRGGAHRYADPASGRLQRMTLAAVLLAMLATGPVPGTNVSVVAMDPIGVSPVDDRAAQVLATSRSADRLEDEDAPTDDEPDQAAEGEEPQSESEAESEAEPESESEESKSEESKSEEPNSEEPKSEEEAKPKEKAEPEEEPEEPKVPKPVGGLNKRQMKHAATIVRVGQEMDLPKYAYVIAIATALQESYLRVLASDRIPESFNYANDGSGNDHDSVGLFQQRPSMGWGTVEECMDPEYSARAFYRALKRVPGWRGMPVTVAAQAVQNSAYPNHYAKHEPLAREIVDALT